MGKEDFKDWGVEREKEANEEGERQKETVYSEKTNGVDEEKHRDRETEREREFKSLGFKYFTIRRCSHVGIEATRK